MNHVCVLYYFFETDKHMRVSLNPQWKFRQLNSAINASFGQLGGSIRRVGKIEYYCPYITLTDASPDGTYMHYWDDVENDLDVTCIFSAHSGEVIRGIEDLLVLAIVV